MKLKGVTFRKKKIRKKGSHTDIFIYYIYNNYEIIISMTTTMIYRMESHSYIFIIIIYNSNYKIDKGKSLLHFHQ